MKGHQSAVTAEVNSEFTNNLQPEVREKDLRYI